MIMSAMTIQTNQMANDGNVTIDPRRSQSGLDVHRQFSAVWMHARWPDMRVDLYSGTTA